MKTQPCWFLLLVAGLAAVVHSAEPPPLDVTFNARLSAPDLKIEAVTIALAGEQAKVALAYVSGRDRHLSIFDPPNGSALKHIERGALTKGSGVVTFEVPVAKLHTVGAITMSFFAVDAAEPDRNFIFLRIDDPALRGIFGDVQARARGGSSPSGYRGGRVNSVAPFADIRWKDASAVADLDAEKIAGLTYNEATRWSVREAEISRDLLRRGRNPGLGVRNLHGAGITGAGVSVGIIDQNMYVDHPEFSGRVARYHDVGCNAPNGSMHGPAVASLLVGKTIGTAPGARLFFAAAPSWTKDAKFYAEALDWLLEVNASLPSAEKIRVISVSAAPSGPGSPFDKNNALWDAAFERAEKAGVLVLDCTSHRGMIGTCYYDLAAPEDLSRVQPGWPNRPVMARGDRILAPSSRRTVAEEYVQGDFGSQYDGIGGLSWSIPYAAGVLALGWQVNPQLSAERMVELLRQTAHVKDGARIINPAAFIEAVKRE